MADSTFRVGVLLDLAAGRFRRGAKAAAKDTDRLGGSLMKTGRSGSLMGRGVAEGARGARREVRRTAQEAQRLGHGLRRTGRDGEQSIAGLTRGVRRYRAEMGLATRAAGRLRGGLLGVAGIAGGGFAVAAGLRRVLTMEQRIERLGIQSKRSTEEMRTLLQQVNATASLPEIRLDPSQVLAAIEAIVEKTGDLEFARDNLVLIAQSIQGSGGTGDALGRLSAELRKLGITDIAGVTGALNLLTAQGKEGAFTLGNLAAEGEKVFSAFARLGYQGPAAARQLGGLLQVARQGTGSAAEAASAFEALLRTLSNAQKIDAIWTEFGVNVQDPTGAFRPVYDVIKELFQATGGDIVEMSRVFDEQAIRALPTTAQGLADYERFLNVEVPADMLARDAARMAETSAAKIQETKTDVDAWLQDKLTGPLGEVVTALTSFKDELLVGVGLLAGSWYAFKGLRAAGSLLWRLTGRGGPPPGTPMPGAPPSLKPPPRPPSWWTGGGPTGRPRNAWPDARRHASLMRSQEQAAQWERTRTSREAAARRSASLMRSREVSLMRSREEAARREAARAGREEAARRSASLMRPGEAAGAGPTSRPRAGEGRLRGTGPTRRPALTPATLSGRGPGTRPNNSWTGLRGTGPTSRPRSGEGRLRGTGPTRRPALTPATLSGRGPGTRPNNSWAGLRGTGPTTRPRSGEGRLGGTGPRTRPKLTPARLGGTGPMARYRSGAGRLSGSGPTSRPRAGEGRLRGTGPTRRPALTPATLSGRGPGTRPNNSWAGLRGTGPTTRPRSGEGRLGGTGPRTRPKLTPARLGGTGPMARYRSGAGRLSGSGPTSRPRAGEGRLRGTGPTRRPALTPATLSGRGPGTRPNNSWAGLRGTGPTSRPRSGEGRLGGTGPRTRPKLTPARLGGTGPMARYRSGAGRLSGSGPTSRPRAGEGRLRGTGPTRRPALTPATLSGRGPGTRPNNSWAGLRGTGPTSRPRNNAWGDARRQASLMRSQAEAARREAARAGREEAARRSASLMRPGEGTGTGPTTRPRNAPARLRPSWAGGLWRALSRGLGPASAGAVMGLAAHDIATGAIPDDQVAPEVGGLAGGLGGSWMAGRTATSLMRSLPGPIRFGGSLLAGLGGWMGGESAGRAATKAVFDPGWTAPESESAAQWILDLIPRHDPDAPPEIGNWRGIGLMRDPHVQRRRRERGRRLKERHSAHVWEPPELPPDDSGARGRRQRRAERRAEGQSVTVNVGPITVQSGATDPREVAEEVADEIERRARDRALSLHDVLRADPTPEAVY